MATRAERKRSDEHYDRYGGSTGVIKLLELGHDEKRCDLSL